MKLSLFPVTLAAAALLSAAAHAQTELTLTVRDSNEGTDLLRWGFQPGATAGLDRALDENEYPPTPPEFLFEARWNDPSGSNRMGQGTKVDFRSPGNNSDTFLLRVQTAVEHYPVTISWPKPGGGIRSAELRFTNSGGAITVVDMMADTSVAVSNAEPVSKIMIVVAGSGEQMKTPGAQETSY